MSSKKQKLKAAWVKAEDEDCYFMLSPQKSLNASLSDSQGDKASHSNESLLASISSDGLLKVQVVMMKEKDLKMTFHMKNSIIELHPDTMQLCEMVLGGPVLLSVTGSSQEKQSGFRVWPSMSIPLGKVAVFEHQMKHQGVSEGDYVSIIKSDSFSASQVDMEMISENDKKLDRAIVQSKGFEKYLQMVLDQRYFVIGQELDVNYFGRTLRLHPVHAQSRENIEAENDSDVSVLSQLQDSISNLSLNIGDTSVNKENLKVERDNGLTSTPKLNKSKLRLPFLSSSSDLKSMSTSSKNPTSNCVVFQFNKNTKISFVKLSKENTSNGDSLGKPFVNEGYEQIGGLKAQIEMLREMIEMPMIKPELFKQSGLSPPTGILLYGPPGTGKSLLARACVSETNVNTVFLQGSSIMSRYFGDSEQKLRDLFDKSRKQEPSVIVIDEIDAICPGRDSARSEVEKRIVAAFITLLDEVTAENRGSSKYVLVLATTNRIDTVDPALRRAGRFDREIEISIPSPEDRVEIFKTLIKKMKHNLKESDITTLADKAHGYVGADIAAVCKEAGMRALKSHLGQGDQNSEMKIQLTDFEFGLKQVPPSAMRELIIQVPKVLWSDIGGNAEVKKRLQQAIEWPLKHPEAFQRLGIEPPRGVLLYGPPGCSKTLTARALATESGLNFISIKGPELFSKYVGDSERAIRRIFSKARSAAPSIVFFDELDALAIERGGGSSKGGGNVADRVLAALLTEMDGVEQRRDVIVVAATNRPDMIDKALLRPGRIDRIVYVPLPDEATRYDILRIQFRKTPIASDVDLNWLVEKTKKYSGAEICSVCREAALSALDDDMGATELTSRDFERALATVVPQTSETIVRMYEQYSKTLQSQIKP